MSAPISAQQASNGRSLDADQIYQMYLNYYADINAKIHAIDLLPYDKRSQANVQQDRAQLIALQQQLYPIYTSDYNNPTATLASFQNDCASIEAQVNAAYNDAIGNVSPIHNQIQKDYTDAQNALADLNRRIAQDQTNITNLLSQQSSLQATITSLQAQINALPDGPQKAQAQQDLDAANAALTSLNRDIATAQSQLATLQGMVNTITAPGGTLDQLKQLAAKQNPTQADLDQANADLGIVQAAETFEQTTLQAALVAANSDLTTLNTAIQLVQKDLIPIPNTHDQIQKDYNDAQNILVDLNNKIASDQSNLNNLLNQKATLAATIASLQTEINALPDGAQKTQAQNDLDAANKALTALNNDIAAAQSQLTTLQGMVSAITAQGGTLDQLNQLAAKQNPTQADLDQANGLLATVQSAQTYEQSLQATLLVANNDLNTVNKAIQTVQKDLQPIPSNGTIEHSTWYIDWTGWISPVPEGVNTVNIFVGNMYFDQNGNPAIGGFGNMTTDKMTAFIAACHAKGIAVKVSIGGGGGSYDRCWDVLTQSNVQSFAQALANLCHTTGADGVDFDPEEFSSPQDRPEQQALVGTLIKDFKTIDPNFLTSMCTNAGFGPYFPWPGIAQNILNAAMMTDPKTGQPVCAVDRMYIMSYYNSLSDEQGWVTGWANWLETNYNFKPSQITVGLDDTDAHAYDIKQFAAWAATQGYSTGYWEWNPATQNSSNKSANDINDAYNNNIQHLQYQVI